MAKRLLVFTGGGLAPALNPTLYGVISRARKMDYEVLGGMYGWACLTHGKPIIATDDLDIEAIRNIGGTFLRSSRTNPFKDASYLDAIKSRIKDEHIDVVIAIGGDDTLGAAKRLHEEHGIAIVGVPKTVDNDLSGTYWSPGFPSAAQTLVDFAREIRQDAAYALKRIFVIETIGMKSGWIAAASAYADADVIIPPERVATIDDVVARTKERYEKNGQYAIVVVSENAKFDKDVNAGKDDQKDMFGHERFRGVGAALRDILQSRLDLDCKMLNPGNFLQSGNPIAIDRDTAIQLGERAVELADANNFGRMPSVKCAEDKTISVTDVPLADVVGDGKRRELDEMNFDFAHYRVKQPLLDYLAPILGPYGKTDHAYAKLIQQVLSEEKK